MFKDNLLRLTRNRQILPLYPLCYRPELSQLKRRSTQTPLQKGGVAAPGSLCVAHMERLAQVSSIAVETV